METELSLDALRRICLRIRRNILLVAHEAKAGHTGGSLSMVEILVCLYFRILRVNPQEPQWPQRDRFVLSKGHATPGYYATLACRGYFDEAILKTFDSAGSPLQGHPDMMRTPGVDMSTGSLGQGLSAGIGMAWGAKALGYPSRIYVLMGDGELQEGQVAEACAFAGFHGLDNLTAIVDSNGLQLSGAVETSLSLEPFRERWTCSNWFVTEADGHNLPSLLAAFEETRCIQGKPQIIRAHTVKGKGVPFIENQVSWHARAPSDEELQRALQALEQEDSQDA